MSEFSESFHLRTDDQTDGVALLERAGVGGWVFPPANGWCMVVVDRDFAGEPDDDVIASNRQILLYYLNAEDHGWGIVLYDGSQVVSSYFIEWTFDIELQDDYAEVEMRSRLGTVPAENWPKIAAQLRPPPDGDDDELTRWIIGAADGTNPGHRVASLLELQNVDWMSGRYVVEDPSDSRLDGAIRVDAT